MRITKYISIAILAAAFTVSCNNDDDLPTTGAVDTDFSGTFAQEDQMGRPGINTVFTPTEADENNFNVTPPATQIANFQAIFQGRIEAYYAAYSNTAGTTLNYENNILGVSLPVLTTVLALDVLQVSPNAPTTYFNPGTDNDNDGIALDLDGDEVVLTGRALNDDVIDVSLILLFGGNNGDRFTSPTNLVSDNVGVEASATSTSFPYLTGASF
jgi:hypothetical protein